MSSEWGTVASVKTIEQGSYSQNLILKNATSWTHLRVLQAQWLSSRWRAELKASCCCFGAEAPPLSCSSLGGVVELRSAWRCFLKFEANLRDKLSESDEILGVYSSRRAGSNRIVQLNPACFLGILQAVVEIFTLLLRAKWAEDVES